MARQSDLSILNNKPVITGLLIIFIFTLFFVLYIIFPDFFKSIDNNITDQLTLLRNELMEDKHRKSPYVVPIYCDDNSLQIPGYNTNDIRALLARVITVLSKLNVSVIGLDVTFPEEWASAQDQQLVDAVKKAGNVYFPLIVTNKGVSRAVQENVSRKTIMKKNVWAFKELPGEIQQAEYTILPFKSLAEAAKGLGHIHFDPDIRGISRWVPLFYEYKGEYIPGLSLKMMCDYLQVPPENIEIIPGSQVILKQAVFPITGKIKDIKLPIDGKGRFISNPADFEKYNQHQYYIEKILEAEINPAYLSLLRDQLEGTAVFISDITSNARNYSPGVQGGILPSSHLHLNVLNSILEEDFYYTAGLPEIFFINIIIILLLWQITCRHKNALNFFVLSLVLFAGFTLFNIAFFISFNRIITFNLTMLPYIISLVGISTYLHFMREQENRLLKLKDESRTKIEEANRRLEKQKEELETANTKLKELDQLKNHFFQNISHEFRTPLTLIKTPLESILQNSGEIPGNIKTKLVMMRKNSGRVLNLINQLMDLSKLEAHKMPLYTRKTDVIALIKDILASFSPLAEKSKINLFLETDLDCFDLYVDREKIKRVIYNLIINSIKFTGDKGQIKVTAALKNEVFSGGGKNTRFEICVADTGAGISDEELPDIFLRFTQGRNSKISAGTGIGLALVKEYVDLHKGSIEVASRINEGTCFTINLKTGKEHLRDQEILPDENIKDDFDISCWLEIDPHGTAPGSSESPSRDLIAWKDTLKDKKQTGGRKLLKKFIAAGKGKKKVFPDQPILVIDDEKDILEGYKIIFQDNSITNYHLCNDSREVLPLLSQKEFSMVLMDISMPHKTGKELLPEIHERLPELPVIIISGVETIEIAVNCLKQGAYDYLTKPVEVNRLFRSILKIFEKKELENEVARLTETFQSYEIKNKEAFLPIITNNSRMKQIFKYMEFIAVSPKPVLIIGESGTGKELIAESLHKLSGFKGKFVKINVAGIDDTVFTDTLFGHKKGAFTGAEQARRGLIEQAREGTLFLDEIGDLSAESQLKLLRLLQEGEYYPLGADEAVTADTRIVLATNVDLKKEVEEKNFRKDLYYRLITHQIKLPSLKERIDDIPYLTTYFVDKAARDKVPLIPDILYKYLFNYSFPGNIRELEGILTNAVSITTGPNLDISSVIQHITSHVNGETYTDQSPVEGEILKILTTTGDLPSMEELEKFLIREAVRVTNGNQSLVAKITGLSQPTIHRRFKDYFK